nr:DUF624 domain-containing protein [Gracilibacillus alcaliphilus]
MEWVARAAGLNLLWILFVLCGFGFFGVFPATVALLMVTRDIRIGHNKGICTSFLAYYVENFVKANVYGYVMFVVNVALILLAMQSMSQFSLWLTVPILVVTILIFNLSLYLLPVFTYFKATFFNHLKLAAIISLSHPMVSFVLFSLVALLFGLIFYSQVLILFPVLFFFFMISVSGYFAMVILLPIFHKFKHAEENLASSSQVSKV